MHLSVILLYYRITYFWFCNQRLGRDHQLRKKGRYLCQTLYFFPSSFPLLSLSLNYSIPQTPRDSGRLALVHDCSGDQIQEADSWDSQKEAASARGPLGGSGLLQPRLSVLGTCAGVMGGRPSLFCLQLFRLPSQGGAAPAFRAECAP